MKIISRGLFILAFTLGCVMVNAQERYFDERSIFNQHYLHPTLINPGAIGFGSHEVMVSYSNAWSSFDNAPSTLLLNYNGPATDKLGFGVQLMKDSYGSLNTTKGQVGLSYKIVSQNNVLGLGITGEYIDHGISGFPKNVQLGDPIVQKRIEGTQYIDVTFGAYGVYGKKLIYGVSFPSLVSARISSSTDTSKEDRTIGFIAQLGYKFISTSTGITMTPSATVKKLNLVPTHIDLNVVLGFLNNKLVGGVGYRVGADKRLGFLLGANVENLSFNYSYSVSSLQFQEYNNGGHELSLKVSFGSQKEPKKVDK